MALIFVLFYVKKKTLSLRRQLFDGVQHKLEAVRGILHPSGVQEARQRMCAAGQRLRVVGQRSTAQIGDVVIVRDDGIDFRVVNGSKRGVDHENGGEKLVVERRIREIAD